MPTTPSFDKPPVIEVSFGVHFARLAKWQTRHFGQFWDHELKSNFPNTEDAPPNFDVSAGDFGFEMEGPFPPLRRVIYSSPNEDRLIQLQDSRLAFNWRKSQTEQQYPRFTTLLPEFRSIFAKYSAFILSQDLGPLDIQRFELAYVNDLSIEGAPLIEALESQLKAFQRPISEPAYLSLPLSLNAAWQFKMRDGGGNFTANVTHLQRPNGQEQVVLALVCHTKEMAGTEMFEWLELAHQNIVYGFADLTTEQAQARWERL